MKSPYLVAIGAVAIALGVAPATHAAEPASVGLDFSLAPSNVDKDTSTPVKSLETKIVTSSTDIKPLAPPTEGSTAPIGSESKASDISKLSPPPSYAGATMEAPPDTHQPISQKDSAPATEVPNADATAPPVEKSVTEKQASLIAFPTFSPAPTIAATEVSSEPAPADQPDKSKAADKSKKSDDSGILSFEPSEPRTIQQAQSPSAGQPAIPTKLDASTSSSDSADLDTLFQQGSDSIVARAVGCAEGTRTPDGGKTWAYHGHVDPGNGVWNLGTFSYQHTATSPEDADQRQLRRLKNQAQVLREWASEKGMQLTLEEELNGIDLANQSPRAALSRGGYIDRLQQAREMGLKGSDAVLWARTRSFLDPDTSQWNAPGLGNQVSSITSDQERRLNAIARAIATQLQPLGSSSNPIGSSQASQPSSSTQRAIAEANAAQIISLDLPPG